MNIDNADIIKAELIHNNVSVCSCPRPHSRAYAIPDKREIHFSQQGATRSTLATFLHEIGHVVKGHGKASKLRRFQREQEAEDYAKDSFKCYDIPYPRKRSGLSRRYVAQWKRIGDNIKNRHYHNWIFLRNVPSGKAYSCTVCDAHQVRNGGWI